MLMFPGITGPSVSDLIGALRCILSVLSCVWGGSAYSLEEWAMNNSRNEAEVILGVDTHLDTHVGVLLNAQGHLLGCLMVTTNNSGYERLVTWANSFGCLKRAGDESTQSIACQCPPGRS